MYVDFPELYDEGQGSIYQGFKTLLRLKKSIEDFGLLSQTEVELTRWGHSVLIQYWD